MADSSHIADLRRRVEVDPTSIAFAQLGEELRRAGDAAEAIEVCRTGLQLHPDYLSARVTLGRALIAQNQLDAAHEELARVLRSAPDNLAAVRAIADIWRQRGDLREALSHYRAALALAHNDPELQAIVARLSRELGPEARSADGARIDRVTAPTELSPSRPQPLAGAAPITAETSTSSAPRPQPRPFDPDRDRARRTVAALEQFLDAIRTRERSSRSER